MADGRGLTDNSTIALRMDDVFASTKQFEVYGKETMTVAGKIVPVSLVANFLFMKYVPWFRRRLPYRELTAAEWAEILRMLKAYKARLTVGVTAAWVEADSRLTPFYEKFPQQAAWLKRGQEEGILEIANHGLTHCVVGKHRPRPFSSNRRFHREFWEWVPVEIQREHLETSQKFLRDYFGRPAVTFIPPGNVWTEETERLAAQGGMKYLCSREALCPSGQRRNGLTFVGDKYVIAFHDRELVLYGLGWLEDLLKANASKRIVTIQEMANL